jgi:agmatine deiminase
MKQIAVLFSALFLVLSSSTKNDRRLLAEWEHTEYVWVQWDKGSYMTGEPIEETLAQLVSTIVPHHEMRILVEDDDLKSNVDSLLTSHGIDTSRIDFVKATAFAAITDPSPVFLRMESGKLATVDFRWNNYGVREVGHPKTIDTDTFDLEMANKIDLQVIDASQLVWEGGAMDHNGKGTILFSEQWMFQRNPNWTKPQIEEELSRTLGIKKVIWLNKGTPEDDFKRILPGEVYPFGTGGHVDEFCRFVNDSTVLLAMPDLKESKKGPIELETYQRMEENYSILKQSVDQDGQLLNIIKVPVPDLIIKKIPSSEINPWDAAWFPGYKEKDSINLVLASSYLNFLLTDKLVIIAKYWKEGRPESTKKKDEAVLELFLRLFPEKTVIPLNPEAFNHSGGGFHCYSYNEPL